MTLIRWIVDRGVGPVAVFCMLAIAAACVVRLTHVLPHDFPVGDGGLFLAMSRDLAANDFVPPAFTSYNGDWIPFVYPPLGLYLLAVVSQVVEPLFALQILPVLLSLATIPAFYLLARTLMPTSVASLLATALFALMPRAFEWLIVGGGITRSLGVTLTLLALWQVARLARTPSLHAGVLAGLLGGLALLSHPETGPFIGVSSVLVVLGMRGVELRALGLLLLAGAVGLAVASPWWLGVLATHGLGPLVAAANSRGALLPSFASAVLLKFSGAEYGDIFAGLGVAALFVELARRRWLLPTWALAAALFTPGGSAALALLPWPLAMGSAGAAVLHLAQTRTGVRAANSAAAGVLGYAVVAAGLAPWSSTSPLSSLPAGVRTTAAWARDEAEPSGAWALVSPADPFRNWSNEWFPALSGRSSVTVAQGYEWVGGDALRERRAASGALLRCATADCVDSWIKRKEVEYLLIVGCCPLLAHLADDLGYREVEIDASDVRLYATQRP